MSDHPPEGGPLLSESILVAIPRGWEGLLLAVLYKAEHQALLDHARLKRVGCDPELDDPHGEAKALRLLIEQQLHKQQRPRKSPATLKST